MSPFVSGTCPFPFRVDHEPQEHKVACIRTLRGCPAQQLFGAVSGWKITEVSVIQVHAYLSEPGDGIVPG